MKDIMSEIIWLIRGMLVHQNKSHLRFREPKLKLVSQILGIAQSSILRSKKVTSKKG